MTGTRRTARIRTAEHQTWPQKDGAQATIDTMWDWLELGLMSRQELGEAINRGKEWEPVKWVPPLASNVLN